MSSAIQTAMPSAPYGAFEEKGYRFECCIPADHKEQHAFRMLVTYGGANVCALLIPMLHLPMYGVDTEDVAALEKVTDLLLGILPESGPTSDTLKLAQHKLKDKCEVTAIA